MRGRPIDIPIESLPYVDEHSTTVDAPQEQERVWEAVLDTVADSGRAAAGRAVARGVGRDRMKAGPGDDEVLARDGRRDRRIACGAGQDVAVVDRDRDPRARGYEEVVYRCKGSIGICGSSRHLSIRA